MKKLLYFIAIINSIGLAQAQLLPQVNWINNNYIACIDSGNSVCHCQDVNDVIMLHADTFQNRVVMYPSPRISPEDITMEIAKIENLPTAFEIKSGFNTRLAFRDTQLLLINSSQVMLFSKIDVPLMVKRGEEIMHEQLGFINYLPLLGYATKPCAGNAKLLLTNKELGEYLNKGNVSLHCSDDFHYNEMVIKKDGRAFMEFFMEYGRDTIKIYKEPLRDKDVAFKPTAKTGCQLFYRVK